MTDFYSHPDLVRQRIAVAGPAMALIWTGAVGFGIPLVVLGYGLVTWPGLLFEPLPPYPAGMAQSFETTIRLVLTLAAMVPPMVIFAGAWVMKYHPSNPLARLAPKVAAMPIHAAWFPGVFAAIWAWAALADQPRGSGR